ncbi:MAG TPA: DUF4280 domain-containing protein [Paraburkholderia sp.]|jgi:hypothetical protein
MGIQVVAGALLKCSFGVAPSALDVLPATGVTVGGMPAATIMDNVPMLNVMPFGMCNCPANPEVIAATAAALGVPTPMPCVPVTVAPWVPGAPTVMLGGMPALDNSSMLMCAWGGVIEINDAGQFATMIP